MSEPAALNTDVEIWRGKSRAEWGDADSFYADSLFIPKSEVEALGINCGGTVIVKPIREWHRLAAKPLPPTAEQTSIGRFNALADQMRRMSEMLDKLAVAHWQDTKMRLNDLLEAIQLGQSADWLQTRCLLDLTNKRLRALELSTRSLIRAKPQPSGKRAKGRR